jgi:beta-lactamase superfamily II metal-dependent hydrolase
MKQIEISDIYSNDNDNLEVYLFNVGQGDHILLKFPSNEYGIIDFFYDTTSNTVWEPPTLSYFKELKQSLSAKEFEDITISFFCISHTDRDHIKGICETVKWFDENGIFIREFWMPAAQDMNQFFNFFKDKLSSFIDSESRLDEKEKRKLKNLNEKFIKNYLNQFYDSFNKWKRKEFQSQRYQVENMGNGEFLHNIRSLRKPCTLANCSALNLGPLEEHVKDYENNLSIEIIKAILGYEKDSIDKNIISHLLLLKFGESKLLFGGDTPLKIWEDCLTEYHNDQKTHIIENGEIDCQFIKVSHHGSKGSSNQAVWDKLIKKEQNIHLGISAGNHQGYKHPDVETINHIKNANAQAVIFSTNICQSTINNIGIEKEYHKWYDDYIRNFGEESDKVIDDHFRQGLTELPFSDIHPNIENNSEKNLGLFAYIFEIPYSKENQIKVRMALSKTNRITQCFHSDNCDQKLASCKKITFRLP